jgi:hypothetical protein
MSVAAIPTASTDGPSAAYPKERQHYRIALFRRSIRLRFLTGSVTSFAATLTKGISQMYIPILDH